MITTTIKLTGTNDEEILYALEEARKLIEEGFNSGSQTREDNICSYSFDTSGEDSEHIECPHCNSYNYYEEEDAPEICFDCGEEL